MTFEEAVRLEILKAKIRATEAANDFSILSVTELDRYSKYLDSLQVDALLAVSPLAKAMKEEE